MIIAAFHKNKKINFFLNQILLILIFATLYYINDKYIDSDFPSLENAGTNKEISFWNCVHFSAITQTTVGYGLISPVSLNSQVINILQLLSIFTSSVSFL